MCSSTFHVVFSVLTEVEGTCVIPSDISVNANRNANHQDLDLTVQCNLTIRIGPMCTLCLFVQLLEGGL